MKFNIYPATQEEVKFIDNKINEFNKSQVPFTQEQAVIRKTTLLKMTVKL